MDTLPISPPQATEATTSVAEVPQFWQDTVAELQQDFTMLVVLWSIIIGLMLVLILKRR